VKLCFSSFGGTSEKFPPGSASDSHFPVPESRIGQYIDGWKMIVSFWDGLFSERFASFRESNHTKSCGFWLKSAYFRVPSGKSSDISLILTTTDWPFQPILPNVFFLKIS